MLNLKKTIAGTRGLSPDFSGANLKFKFKLNNPLLGKSYTVKTSGAAPSRPRRAQRPGAPVGLK
jgi:hypothetical protein